MPHKSKPIRQIGMMIGFIFLAGCTSLMRTPVPPWTVYDPLRGLSDQMSQEFLPSAKAKDSQRAAIALSPSQTGRKLESEHRPKSSRLVNGPKIVPQNIVVSRKLNLTIKVSEQKQVGSPATFQLVIWNSGGTAADNVTIAVDFDEALVFPGQREKQLQRSLGRIGPQERKKLALTLTSDQAGRHSCRFTLTSDGVESVWKSVAVEFFPRRLDVQIIGPSRRTIGSRAEYVVKLSNKSSRDLQNVRLTLNHDAALQPKETSEGVVQNPGTLIWNLDTLRPSQGIQLVAEFDCTAAAVSAYVFARATGNNVPDERVGKYLAITPVEGILDFRIDDSVEPLKCGEETQFTVSIHNRSLQVVRQMHLQTLVPTNMRVIAVQVFQAGQPLDLNFELRGQQLSFDPISRLGPETSITFEIQTKALRAGDAEFHASLKHSTDRIPREVSELTTVNP